jgi:hypothetical protein
MDHSAQFFDLFPAVHFLHPLRVPFTPASEVNIAVVTLGVNVFFVEFEGDSPYRVGDEVACVDAWTFSLPSAGETGELIPLPYILTEYFPQFPLEKWYRVFTSFFKSCAFH